MNAGQWVPVLPGLTRWISGLSGPQQPVNSYVWEKDGETILIDPAADLNSEALFSLGLRRVAHILVTHCQEENMAGSFHFPDAQIHVPAGDEYLTEGAEACASIVTPWPPPWDWETRGSYHGHLAGARNERPSARPLRLSAALIPGERVADFRILSTPGHGKHAVSLIAEIAGVRVGFCGDLIYGEGRLWNWFDSEWDYGLQRGQQALLKSARRMKSEEIGLLCPAHGDVICDPGRSLALLCQRLDPILALMPSLGDEPINFPEKDSLAPGFRELLPGLHQWRDGNCTVLISGSGNALLVDDGLCYWRPLPERTAHHRAMVAETKRSLKIRKIELVIPTHYHGDHTENIPDLIELEGTQVACLDLVAEPMEHPQNFNLACSLPWYGTNHTGFKVQHRLKDGAHMRWHEFDLEVFHLGGQTYYALGVNLTIQGVRTLFVGDAMDLRNPICEPVLCYNKADPESAGWAGAVERMIERRPDLLVCGHGSAIRDPLPLLLKKREAWQQRLKEFHDLSARADLREFFDPFPEPHKTGN